MELVEPLRGLDIGKNKMSSAPGGMALLSDGLFFSFHVPLVGALTSTPITKTPREFFCAGMEGKISR